MIELTVSRNDSGQRADKFLLKVCPNMPKNLLYKAFRKKDIKRNGKRCTPEEMLCEGDVLRAYLPADIDIRKPPQAMITQLPPPVVVYEDENICLMHKPVGVPVHADDKGTVDTMIARFTAYLYHCGLYVPQREQSFTPALCNRLDRNTDGLCIGAKNAAALRCVNEMIRNGEVQKEYLCVVVGKPPKSADIVIAYHRKTDENKAILRYQPFEGAKPAKTGYELLDTDGTLSLVRVRLYTGRTHQIRAQMALLGCPILGDGAYGNKEANQRYGECFQLLTAYRLTFCSKKNDSVVANLHERCFTITPAFTAKYFRQCEHITAQ